MSAPLPPRSSRIDIVDALRGFAMMGICLLHFVEHFDMGGRPAFPPAWLKPFDTWANDSVFFIFAGKSYSLFAMMFGLSFFILMDNASKRGEDFRLKFAWRMAVLLGLGYVHSLLFVGDFLTTIALLGCSMLLLWKMPSRLLWVVAIALLLMLPNLVSVARLFLDSGYSPDQYKPGRFYKDVGPAFLNGSLSDVLRANLWLGHKAKWCWTIENGRYLQMLGLFSLGLLLGRSRLFSDADRAARLAWRLLLASCLLLVPLYLAKQNGSGFALDKNGQKIVIGYLSMQIGLVQMLGGVSLLVLLFRTRLGARLLSLLIPYGRMSLSCYVTQAVVGVPLFYNYGLGMYRHMGPFYSALAGIAFFIAHLALAHWWLRHFQQGPLEWLWRCLTEMDFQRPLRRRPEPVKTEKPREMAGLAR